MKTIGLIEKPKKPAKATDTTKSKGGVKDASEKH